MNPRISAITADETLGLRQKVLRPGQDLRELVYPGDLDPMSLHVGGFALLADGVSETIVGVASVYQQAFDRAMEQGLPNLAGDGVWRLRGMATDESVRGTGLGGRLLMACIEHTMANEGGVLWCNARVPASGFYLRYGFRIHGGAFELPKIGPHFLMSKELR